MPALKNPVYEAFSQETFRRLTTGDGAPFQGRVYSAIGFTKNANSARVQASRMMKANPEISARIKELLDEAAKASKNTVQSIGAELDEARQLALKNNQTSAAVAASLGKAKLYGLEPASKTEIGPPGTFDYNRANTVEELCRQTILNEIRIEASLITPEMVEMMREELDRRLAVAITIARHAGVDLMNPNAVPPAAHLN